MTAKKNNRKRRKPGSRHGRRSLKWGRLLFLVFLIMMIPAAITMAWNLKNPLHLKNDVYQVQLNSEYDPYGNIKSIFLDSVENVTPSGDVDVTAMGTYSASYTYKGKEYPFTVQVGDFEGPDMTLQDYSTDTVETVTAETFLAKDENGNYMISDDSGWNLKLESDDSDKSAGTYTVTVTAKDNYGNTTEKTARLTRTEDTKAPVLEGFEDSATVKQGLEYYVKHYPLSDDLDSAPTMYADGSVVDTDTPGTYEVSYTVRDRSGNENVYTQTVTVTEDPDRDARIVYLTFDDGPSANTEKVLQILEENDVSATFFVTGNQPSWNKILKEITDAGSVVGLHTYTHNYDQIYASTDAYFEDLQQISDLVKEQTGQESMVIRFPGGSSNLVSSITPGIMSELAVMVHDRGYEYFDWNVDSGDANANGVDVEEIIANAEAGIGMQRPVILFHDTDAKDTTVEALPAIIKAYKDAGYSFGTLTTDSVIMHHHIQN